jgi:hypothetical protein
MFWILSLISILLVMIIAGPLIAYHTAFSQTQNNNSSSAAAAAANSGGMSTKSVEIAKSGSKNLILNSTGGGANNNSSSAAAAANSGGMSTKSVEIAKGSP